MRKAITIIAAVVAAVAVLSLPAAASAGVHKAAKSECKQERRTDTREFKNKFGGTGKKALKRCIGHEKRDAERECKRDRKHETNEFIREYGGTGRKALKRCMVDEIR